MCWCAWQGLWPAFWMMPQDNAYGKWAASGELDIFESRNNLTEVTNNLNFGEFVRGAGPVFGRFGGTRTTLVSWAASLFVGLFVCLFAFPLCTRLQVPIINSYLVMHSVTQWFEFCRRPPQHNSFRPNLSVLLVCRLSFLFARNSAWFVRSRVLKACPGVFQASYVMWRRRDQ